VRLPRRTIAATTVTTRSATTPAMPSSPAAIVPTLAGRRTTPNRVEGRFRPWLPGHDYRVGMSSRQRTTSFAPEGSGRVAPPMSDRPALGADRASHRAVATRA
jgi:hypothetical protein